MTVYDWLGRKELQPRQRGVSRVRKIDREALAKDVQAHPDAFLKERAARFGVHVSSMGYALAQLKLARKKNVPICSGNTQKR